MGFFLNPGHAAFSGIRNDLYIDKSGMIDLINQTIETPRRLTCVSRPRRFGKSFSAQMLCAYYDRCCDSHALFDDLKIADTADYAKHLNRYDVIYIDMSALRQTTDNYSTILPYLAETIIAELRESYPDVPDVPVTRDLPAALLKAAEISGRKFFMIIDEWDAPIRETPGIQEDYLIFLRSLFKNSGVTARIFAGAFMTGILPIKKNGSQSAISDFEEFTMLSPLSFSQYIGFTEHEVRVLCDTFHRDFAPMKQWYDGYRFEGVGSIYNPNSVIKALRNNRIRSYWTESSAADSLLGFISRDEKGLGQTIAKLIGGVDVPVNVNSFVNDLVTFRNQDDVLTLLVHLGYLSYDEDTKMVHIPNEEVRLEFTRTIHEDRRPATMQRVAESDQLILDTIHEKADAVARQIEKVHMETTNPLNANNENSLRAVIQLAYFSYKDYYIKMEELPSGRGYADIVYLPRHGESMPALLIELKWNDSPKAAIQQIKDRHYPQVLHDYGGEILLVGINYDKDIPAGQRKYNCIIEKYVYEGGFR